jgi:protein phosphatase 2C family protein 2/3
VLSRIEEARRKREEEEKRKREEQKRKEQEAEERRKRSAKRIEEARATREQEEKRQREQAQATYLQKQQTSVRARIQEAERLVAATSAESDRLKPRANHVSVSAPSTPGRSLSPGRAVSPGRAAVASPASTLAPSASAPIAAAPSSPQQPHAQTVAQAARFNGPITLTTTATTTTTTISTLTGEVNTITSTSQETLTLTLTLPAAASGHPSDDGGSGRSTTTKDKVKDTTEKAAAVVAEDAEAPLPPAPAEEAEAPPPLPPLPAADDGPTPPPLPAAPMPELPRPQSGLKLGAGATQGRRPDMEDAHTAILSLPDAPDIAFVAVYDGHGGRAAAEYCAEKLHRNVCKDPAFRTDLKRAIHNGFLRTDRKFLEICRRYGLEAGCTACAVFVTPTRIYVANAGDCRCILSRGGKLVILSNDHKPWDAAEMRRIEAAGYVVEDNRVDGRLAVSRAIGDLDFKLNPRKPPEEQAVTCAPEIIEEPRTPDDEYLVVACDGLWDILENESVLEFISTRTDFMDYQSIAQELVDYAVEIGTMDNTTCVILAFK